MNGLEFELRSTDPGETCAECGWQEMRYGWIVKGRTGNEKICPDCFTTDGGMPPVESSGPYDENGHLVGCGLCAHGERCTCDEAGLIVGDEIAALRAQVGDLKRGLKALRDNHQRVAGGIYASEDKPICWPCSLNDDWARHVEPWPCPGIRELNRLFGDES